MILSKKKNLMVFPFVSEWKFLLKGTTSNPEWENSDDSRIPVYSKEAADLEADRPALMKALVAEAGKYGFEFQKKEAASSYFLTGKKWLNLRRNPFTLGRFISDKIRR